jgi:hypothetical protein
VRSVSPDHAAYRPTFYAVIVVATAIPVMPWALNLLLSDQAGRLATQIALHIWVYLAGPLIGALVAVAFAHLLRGRGGDRVATRAAQGDSAK